MVRTISSQRERAELYGPERPTGFVWAPLRRLRYPEQCLLMGAFPLVS